jgi:uncharacterized protein involved in exopolysaccharide biosynthesis
MSGTGVKSTPHIAAPEILEPVIFGGHKHQPNRERQALLLRLLWDRRRFLLQAAFVGLVVSALIAFLIPASYTSTAQLMPPDNQSSSGLAMMAAMASSKPGGGLAGMAGDLLGLKNSGAMFIGVLKSETSQDRIIQQFDLKKVYGVRLVSDARKKLDSRTNISEERKSGIISIEVTDHNPDRAAAIANAYIEELNVLVAQLSTSAAHRERVFLEDRLKVAKQELDEASNQLAQFSSKNTTLDMQTEGKAMLDAAGMLAGELIAAQSELQGLRQIYTDNNARVRALNARVDELRKQLERLGGAKEEFIANTNQGSDSNALRVGEPGGDKLTASPFPTIRKLPLLGAKYSDYYRQAKIQETVFELLTEQYEMAKVQEAKETPSVKILDPGRVPDKKSFPPRLLIIFVGAGLAFAAAAFWILGARSWAQVDSGDPRKILALEVAATCRANAPWTPQNGDASETWAKRVWRRLGTLFPPTDGPSVS